MNRRTIAALGIALAAVLAAAGCQRMQGPVGVGNETSTTAGQEEGTVAQAQPGTAATIVIGSTSFTVEIAQTDAEKEHGLMGRESLAPNGGMWFVFDHMVQEQFWMKDTPLSLDLIFVGSDMKIVSIAKNAKPMSTDTISSDAPYQYVLEVNAGTADKYGFKVGDAVQKRIGPQ
jgi:uncharacterized protein